MTDETNPQQQPRPEARTRPTIAQRATSWIAWHAGELAAVGVPSLGAATVHPLLWVLTAGAGAAWGTHEYRQQRHRQQMLASPDRPAVPAVPAADEDRAEDVETTTTEQTDETDVEVHHA